MRIRDFFIRLTRNWPAKVISFAAAVLLFLFYQFNSLEERFFTVPVMMELNEGFLPAGPYPKSARVILRGEGDDIFLVEEDDIEVYIDLSSHNTEGLFRAPLEYRKMDTAQRIDPLEIRVEPFEATVELERKLIKDVKVEPVIHGYPEQGYELSEYSIVPGVIELEGPRSHITEVNSLKTEAVDLTGRNTDFTIRLMIESTDPYIKFRGGDIVEFAGVIREAVMVKTYATQGIVLRRLPAGLEAEEPQVRGSVKVQGTQLFLEDYRAADIELFADCSDISEPGRYQVAVRPQVPRELLVITHDPETVEILVREAPPVEEEE